MRAFVLVVVIGLWARMTAPLQAQCPGCIANLACSVDPAYPTLCPMQPPDATAGESYEADITFWLPANFDDPGSGFNVDFLLMTITGVSGLPYGLDITYSDALGVYHPQDDQYGCARICGTPISAGTYTVTISIIAQVDYNGLTLNVPQQFPLTLIVQAGTGSNTGFTFTPTTGCGIADVQFNALIDGQGAPVTYAWDFGNGSTSTDPASLQHYDAPSAYTITLQTTIGGFVLNNVNVGGVNDNWCGDVEEISLFGSCQGSPDIYFVLTDGQGGTYTSSSGSDSNNESWSGLDLTLGTPPYAIEFWDEDPISVDDALGTYNIPQNGAGTYNFNVAGGTFGSLVIDLVPQQVFNDTDVVTVFAAPQPVMDYDTLLSNLCITDTSMTGITWFNDGDTVFTGNLPCISADSTGTWWAMVSNAFGCSTVSDTVVICPAITIEQSGEVLYTENGLNNYSWTLNGEPVPGADGPFIIAETGGLYAVSAMNADGCALSAEFQLVITGDPYLVNELASLEVFPNPNNGSFSVRAPQGGMLRLMDLCGRIVHTLALLPGVKTHEVDAGMIAPGTYWLLMETGQGTSIGRMTLVR